MPVRISRSPDLRVWLLAVVPLLFGACNHRQAPDSGPTTRYVVTIHPFAAILQEVAGERAQVAALLPVGASPHTYDPRPSDVRTAERSTALFYGSPDLDGWASRLSGAPPISLLDLVPATHRLPPGEDHLHDHGSGAYDPHFWTDPLTVKAMLPALSDTLCSLDPAGCITYRSNAAVFSSRLDSLHASLQVVTEPIRGKTVMLSHPFFRYFMERYGLTLVSPVETMPGKEPTVRDLQRLVELAQREHVDAVFVQPQLPHRAARAVSEAADLKLGELDPIGGVPERRTYAELLRYNARVLLETLQ